LADARHKPPSINRLTSLPDSVLSKMQEIASRRIPTH
jgi:hypothetical protein